MKILHMYPDLMNLYGEYANMTILKRFLEECGEEVSLDTLSLYESKDISGYDMYYMGAGTEKNMRLVLDAVRPFADTLIKAKNDGAVMLFTGNAMEIMGSKITDAGTEIKGLGLADFETLVRDKRMTGDIVGYEKKEAAGGKPDLSKYIVGFSNKCSVTKKVNSPWFFLEMGDGNYPEEGVRNMNGSGNQGYEGCHENNMYCTHITGPLLVKNPYLLKKFASLLMKNDKAFAHEIKEQVLSFDVTLKALLERI